MSAGMPCAIGLTKAAARNVTDDAALGTSSGVLP